MIPHIVVIGGGITGLAAAERLTRDGSPGQEMLQVTVLEAGERFGGHVHTERFDGFVLERGPDVLLAAKPAAVELAARVGLGDRIQATNPAVRGAYVLSQRGLVPLPEGLTGLVPSRLWPFVTTRLLSPLGKLRVGLDWFIPAKRTEADESVETFVVRRLGRAMYDHVAEPLLSGISAADGSRLSLGAMFPQLQALEREHGGLLRGMRAARRTRRQAVGKPPATAGAMGSGRPHAPGAPTFVSFPAGMGELVEGVERALRSREGAGARIDLRTGASVRRILRRPGDDSFLIELATGETLPADGVILAVPAYVASPLVGALDETLGARLREIEYASTVTVSVAYRRAEVPHALNGTGYVVPRVRRRPVLACTWSSRKFAGRAPDDHALFRLFLGGAGRGAFIDAPDDELREIVRREMRDVLGVTAPARFERITRLRLSMPQYAVGHPGLVAAIERRAAGVGPLHLAGAAYGGVGIPDCIRSGERAAVAALRDVAARSEKIITSPS